MNLQIRVYLLIKYSRTLINNSDFSITWNDQSQLKNLHFASSIIYKIFWFLKNGSNLTKKLFAVSKMEAEKRLISSAMLPFPLTHKIEPHILWAKKSLKLTLYIHCQSAGQKMLWQLMFKLPKISYKRVIFIWMSGQIILSLITFCQRKKKAMKL